MSHGNRKRITRDRLQDDYDDDDYDSQDPGGEQDDDGMSGSPRSSEDTESYHHVLRRDVREFHDFQRYRRASRQRRRISHHNDDMDVQALEDVDVENPDVQRQLLQSLATPSQHASPSNDHGSSKNEDRRLSSRNPTMSSVSDEANSETAAAPIAPIDWNALTTVQQDSRRMSYGDYSRDEFVELIRRGQVNGMILGSSSSHSPTQVSGPGSYERPDPDASYHEDDQQHMAVEETLNNGNDVTIISATSPEDGISTLAQQEVDDTVPGKAVSQQSIVKSIKQECKRVGWKMGMRLPQSLRTLGKQCISTRHSYYRVVNRQRRQIAMDMFPCVSCGLPLSVHRAASLCKLSQQEVVRTSHEVNGHQHCDTCGHAVSAHRDTIRRITPTKSVPVSLTTMAMVGTKIPSENIRSNNVVGTMARSIEPIVASTLGPKTSHKVEAVAEVPVVTHGTPVRSTRVRVPASRFSPSPDDDDDDYDDDDDDDNDDKGEDGDDDGPRDKPSYRHAGTECILSYEEIVALCKTTRDYITPCSICGALPKQHKHAPDEGRKEVKSSESRYKMPPRTEFPTFRDPNNEDMKDPRLFFRTFMRKCDYHRVPESHYKQVLVACMPTDLLSAWVEDNIVNTSCTWEEAMDNFTTTHSDPQLQSQLVQQLDTLHMKSYERSSEYFEHYITLMNRLGYPLTSADRIIDCERGLTTPLRAKVAEFKALQQVVLGRAFEYESITALKNAVAVLEKGFATQASKVDGRGKKRDDHRQHDRGYKRKHAHVNAVHPATKKQVSFAPAIAEEHPSKRGGKASKAIDHVNSIQSNNKPSVNRGGATNRGGHRRPSIRGRPSLGRPGISTSNTCWKCGQVGHVKSECTNTQPSISAVSATSNNRVPVSRLRRAVTVKSAALGNKTFESVLLDSGSQLSAVSDSVVKLHRIPIIPPLPNEPQHLMLADKSKSVQRIGHVMLPVTVQFHHWWNSSCTLLTHTTI